MRMWVRFLMAIPGALVTISCLAEEPSAVRVERAEDVGALTFGPLIHVRDGGVSGAWRGKSIWLFGDTVTTRPAESGLNWLSNTVAITDLPAPTTDSGTDSAADPERAGTPCDCRFEEYSDRMEPPLEFIPWTPEEAKYNAQNFTAQVDGSDRRRYAIWPGAMVSAQDDRSAVIFFTKLTAGSGGAWDFRPIERSVVVWRDPDEAPERVERALFPEGDIQLGDAACRVGDMVYAYGFEQRSLSWPVRLGRVPFDQIADREAWEFRTSDGWEKDAARAAVLFDGAPMMSVHYNEAIGCFLCVYTVPLENRLALRTAPAPDGPWSEPVPICECRPTTFSIGCYAGVAHPEFSQDGGLTEYVTYYRETGFFQGEIRVVRVRLSPL
ncbi:MAG: DUF4185 domain-containing protein [Planctomycetia bacterium]|nr:DUF4185 domain-containing protein [Planctomycetia bacterium]